MRTLIAIVAALGGTAQAQEVGFDAHGISFGPLEADLRDPLTWVRPGVYAAGDVYGGVVGEYARRPLVEVTTSEAGGDLNETALIRDLAVANVVAGVAVHKRLRLDLSFPVYVLSTSESELAGPAPGDLRARLSTALLRPADTVGGGGIGLGGTVWFDAPTGTPERYLGRSGIAGGGELTFTAEVDRLTLNAAAGVQLDPKVDVANVSGADQLLGRFGLSVALSDRFGLVGEVDGAVPLASSSVQGTTTPAEARLALRGMGRSGVPAFTVGVGRALTGGIGAPELRAFVGIAFGRTKPLRASDSDPLGSVSIVDRCPLQPETRNGYEDLDGCPDELGRVRAEVVFEGAPRYGAALSFVGGELVTEQAFAEDSEPVVVMPGVELTVSATGSGCLAGQALLEVEEGDNPVTIELQRVLDAHVTVRAEDIDGNSIQGAEVAWLSDEPLCVPNQARRIGRSGEVHMAMGSGTHNLVVNADGYEMIYESFTFERGQDRTLAVVLTPDPTLAEDAPVLVEVQPDRLVTAAPVLFEAGKAVLHPEAFAVLDAVAEVMVEDASLGVIEVGGHTTDLGDPDRAMDLSQRRADAVRAFLVRRGVPEDRLVATGFGDSARLPVDGRPQAVERISFLRLNTAGGTP